MKPSLVFFSFMIAGSALAFVAADKRRLCIEVCWTYHVLDQTCPDNCLASLHPTDEEATLTEECMGKCTTSHISSPTGIDMKAYADCRSGCYNKYFAPFINTYRPPRMNKRSPTPEIISNKGQEAPSTDKMYTLNCLKINSPLEHKTKSALACHNSYGDFVKEYPMISSGIKLLSSLHYPLAERNPDGEYENNISISDIKEYPDECISSPVSTEINSQSLHDQTAQLVLDCSSSCSSDESGAVFEPVDFGSCLDSCFTKRTSGFSLGTLIQIEQGFDGSNTAENSDPNNGTPESNSKMLEPEESDVVAMNNYLPPTPSSTPGGNGSLVRDGNSTGHAGQSTHIGEVNGALSWAESAYHSFWFFAWALAAVAIAIGTQML